MNGYQINADAYKKYLAEHPDEPAEVKADMQRKISALEIMANTDDATKCEIFNTSAFNDIAKGYFLMAINYVLFEADIEEIESIDDDDRNELKRHLRNQLSYLFDTATAAQAKQYYIEH